MVEPFKGGFALSHFRHALSASCILGTAILALSEIIFGQLILSAISLVMLMGALLLELDRVKLTARLMLLALVVVLGLYLMGDYDRPGLITIAARASYLPALITVLIPLRISAMSSRMVHEAGEFIVHQPPARRFAFLSFGGHIFGVLLNIGGLLLLMHVALRGPKSRAIDDPVRTIQIRRISSAVMRGFSANIFWSPLGLGLNMLLTLVPGTSWTEFLPYGLAAAAVSLTIGWCVDYVQSPKMQSKSTRPGAARVWGLFGLLAVLIAISGGAALIETLFGLPLRGAMLIIVPLFSFGWAMISQTGGARVAVAGLCKDTFTDTPKVVNELAIITSAGLLGLIVSTMIPGPAVAELIVASGLSGSGLAIVLSLLILIGAVLGLNPMIASTIGVSAVVAAGIDIAPELLLLSALSGWAIALIVSPATSTLAIAANATDHPPIVAGVKWNWLFCLAVECAAAVAFYVFW